MYALHHQPNTRCYFISKITKKHQVQFQKYTKLYMHEYNNEQMLVLDGVGVVYIVFFIVGKVCPPTEFFLLFIFVKKKYVAVVCGASVFIYNSNN